STLLKHPLSHALMHAEKRPQRAIYPWNSSIARGNGPLSVSEGWIPNEATPLVYHLHGVLDLPESLVVTEDDYIEFVTSMAKDRPFMPPLTQAALPAKPLLFIGYGLRDATFRIMFNALLSAVPEINRRSLPRQ